MTIQSMMVRTRRGAFGLRTVGSGAPVLLLHGITANAAVWDPIAESLGNQNRIFALDQRGHGQSDRPGSGYAATDYAEDVLAVLEKVADGPALVVGHSLGARNAIVAAALSAKRIAGVVVVDLLPGTPEAIWDQLEGRVAAADRVFRDREAVIAFLRSSYPSLPDDAIRRRAKFGYEDTRGGVVARARSAALAQVVAGLRDDFGDAFSSARVPVRVVRGTRSPFVSDRAIQRAHALRPGAAIDELDADHFIPETHPGELSELVRCFAEEIGYGARS